MVSQTKCNLLVIGPPGAGKTFLLSNIFNSINLSQQTNSLINIRNITLKTNSNEINVDVKEFRKLDATVFKYVVNTNSIKTLIIFILSLDDKINTQSIPKVYVNKLKLFSNKAKIIVVLRSIKIHNPITNISNTNINIFPFANYILPVTNIIELQDNSLIDLEITVKQIIANLCTNQLQFAKQLVKENKIAKSKTLDLGKCYLTDLMDIPELFENTHLETLILSNEWGEFQNGEWRRKVSNNKGDDNILFNFPKDIKRLINLKVLICGGNWKSKNVINKISNWYITDISMLSSLNKLNYLNVSNNTIDIVGNINELNNIHKLYLNNNNINKFPNILNLKLLTELNLSNNKIVDVNFLENCEFIKTIDIHSNFITDLTPIKSLVSKLDIRDSKWEVNTISVGNNPLVTPKMEIISQGKKKVMAYFRQSEAEFSVNLRPFINRDVKLILVGNSNVGKSTLVHWLLNNTLNKKISSTHWLQREKWIVSQNRKAYCINIFDFGGQEYYHDTHYLFFTNKTVYLVLWENSTNHFDEVELEQRQADGNLGIVKSQSFPIEFWLDSIKFHTKKRNKSETERAIHKLIEEREKSLGDPNVTKREWAEQLVLDSREVINGVIGKENILIVQNKVDNRGDRVFINEELIKSKYKNVYDFIDISMFTKRGLISLRDNLFEIIDLIPTIGQEYLGTWGIIKKTIENKKHIKHFTLEEFNFYCNEIIHKIPQVKNKSEIIIKDILFTKDDTDSFAQYLSDIGVLLYYPENNSLKNKVFINQDIILDNIYNILINLSELKGEFDKKHILRCLNKHEADNEVTNIIDLMLHFKIIFEHPIIPDTYIAPLYLPKQPVQGIKLFSHLYKHPVFRYQYKSFIYKNVILDIFSKYGKKALKENNSTDLFYYWRDGLVVKEEFTGEVIMIKFIPANKIGQKSNIDVLVLNPGVDESFLQQIIGDIDDINIDLDANKCVSSNGIDFIPLNIIHEHEAKENWVFQFEDKYFDLIEFKKYLKNKIKMKKLFISYSKLDLRLVNKFIEHLSALKRDGKVAHWYCSELDAGSKWNDEIQSHLDESDIICFMVSPNFMKTDYIHEHEITKAFERKARDDKFRIVPIILDFCRWNTSKNDLGQYTALPYTAKPVVDFKNQNMAWYIIEECLRAMIDNELEPKGDKFYKENGLAADIKKIYERIVDGKIDDNN